MGGDATIPLADPLDEARRLIAGAESDGVVMRALGGVAFALQARTGRMRLERRLKDVDLVVARGRSKATTTTVLRHGYLADEMFNALRGHERLLFYDPANDRHLDVFVGAFSLCHKVPIADRLTRDDLTIPREELLITKLQIVTLTENDRIDVLNLLLDYPVVPGPDSAAIDATYIAGLLAQDWGLWRTCTMNIERILTEVDTVGLASAEREQVAAALDALRSAIGNAHKSTKWRMRSRVGDRVKWYKEPTEEP